MEGNVEHVPAELEGLVRVRRAVNGAMSRKDKYRHWVTRYTKIHGHPPNKNAIAKWLGQGLNSRKKN